MSGFKKGDRVYIPMYEEAGNILSGPNDDNCFEVQLYSTDGNVDIIEWFWEADIEYEEQDASYREQVSKQADGLDDISRLLQ